MLHGPSQVRRLIPIQVCAEGSKLNSLLQPNKFPVFVWSRESAASY